MEAPKGPDMQVLTVALEKENPHSSLRAAHSQNKGGTKALFVWYEFPVNGEIVL